MSIRKHAGGTMPCDPETLTMVKYRGGEVSPCALPARCRAWRWPLEGVGEREWDITAWREATAEDEVCGARHIGEVAAAAVEHALEQREKAA